MKNLKKEAGSITVVVFATVTFMLIILATIFTSMIYKRKSQAIELQELKEIYNPDMYEKLEEYKESHKNEGTKKITDSGVKPTSATDAVVPLSTDETTDLEDDQGNIVKVPENFGIAYDSADNVTEGIVIEDTDHNQYVWIPVGEGIKKSDGETTVDISLIRSDFNGTTTENAEDVIDSYYYEYEENPEGTSYENIKAKSLSSFINSVSDNGGYYIARYEAGIDCGTDTPTDQYNYAGCSGSDASMTYGDDTKIIAKNGDVKPLSKSGVGVWNAVTQSEAATICRAMYTKARDGVESDLVNSFAWDTAIDFIQQCGTASNSSSYATTSGKSKSTSDPKTSGTNILNATNELDQQCKIFDMAGNVREWSTETGTETNCPCGCRGGDFLFKSYTSKRLGGDTSMRVAIYGFRAILYL